ncbi:uncharacterized protein EI90DRAFT_3073687 [Cantharellus anzutake]|uniref:uncharacterized protein n=1 Tax=Cantharellus anzutake TaxID=1750568 RepID=UPI0019085B6E|nr:uncharacterized protein EI90DRAFT_3073687 [Cantharellus anzutake]KAF8325277.1 hypothetical protein EI90DRAFT_3073687 [Cantharellus anzutake]
MARTRLLRITPSARRSAISSLFALTFIGSILTVSASSILPCPARPSDRSYLTESGDGHDVKRSKRGSLQSEEEIIVMSRKSHHWIEEKIPPRQ